MKQVAIFMSDFHLGQRDRTEEFFADEEFSELLSRLSLEHTENKVDLVLLGDVIDLWATVINGKEMTAGQIDEVDLYLPAKTKEEKKYALVEESKKLNAIINSHSLFFESLGRFLIDAPRKRRIVYVYGNHDHSLVDGHLQQQLRHKILSSSVLELAKKCTGMERPELETYIKFDKCYEDGKILQVYAEHGNQLAYGGIFRYEDNKTHQSTFGDSKEFGVACPGYVHFKLVTSRVIRLAPKLNGLLMGVFNPTNWPHLAVWLLLRGYFRALIYMQLFWIQFKHYECTDQNKGNWRVPLARECMPGPWKTFFDMLNARLRSFTKDEFGDKIPKLFETDDNPLYLPLCGHKLSPDTTKTIILGHSHGVRDIDVPGFEGLKYYNTGSWALKQEKNKEIIEQTWVVVSTELPVTITSVQSSQREATLTVKDEFRQERRIKVLDPDAQETLKPNDKVIIETDEKGNASRIMRDDRTSPRIIERQLVRRRVERASLTSSPVTVDGARLNPLLRSMNLQVGDLILFRRNVGPYLWRLARSFSFGKLFVAIPGVIIAFINRFGTSSYWNHIAMIFGAPSEPREYEHYNDPLIIESVPNIGVRIHTPEHYLQFPKEWNFAVLRLTGPLLKSWEARRLLRRITLNYLGAAYDKKSVTRGTIQYAAFATNAKGRSALGGIVIGAMLGVVLLSCSALWWARSWLKEIWNSAYDAFLVAAAQFIKGVRSWLSELVQNPSLWEIVKRAMTFFALLVGTFLALYVLLQFGRLLVKTWFALTASVGAFLGACIVPIMADMTDGWAKKSVMERYAFAFIWFSPLLFLIASTQLLVSITDLQIDTTWGEYLKLRLMLILTSGLFIVLFPGIPNFIANFLIARWRNLQKLANRSRPIRFHGNYYPLHKQFICSGLVQDAFVETARELQPPNQDTSFKPFADSGRNEFRPQAEQPAHGHEKVEALVGLDLVPVAHAEACRERSKNPELVAHTFPETLLNTSSNEPAQRVDVDVVQSTLRETHREERMNKIFDFFEQVVVNPDWDKVKERSQAEQSCVLRDTLPRHFALAQDKFSWTYVHLDNVLTPTPAESFRAQAYTDPLNIEREKPPLTSLSAIRFGFIGLGLTLGTAFPIKSVADLLEGLPRVVVFSAAGILGAVALYRARQARIDLILHPNKRGRALTIGGFISGVLAILFAFIGLETLASLPAIIWAPLYFLLAVALLSGFLFLF
jgi:UDP-2,3-diacylglucosamine pyrophosphatase LpxH